LSSLDITRAGRHGLDLSLAASYSADKAEDEDMAGANHQVKKKMEKAHPYAPDDGFTTPVPRFRDDIAALQQLTRFDLPPLRVVRPTQVVQVFYGFGDASGKQFGATLLQNYNCKARLTKATTSTGGVRFRVGLWSAAEEEESSNFKELKILVDTVDKERRAGCRIASFSSLRTIQRLKVVSTEEAQNPDTSMLLCLRSKH
jgi:hypothetical protein